MSDWEFKALDLRWLLYRQACRWQLGETEPRWVAVAVMVTVEAGWAMVGFFSVDHQMGWHLQLPPKWANGLVILGLYALNWWVVVPAGGLAKFEERYRRWPESARSWEAPFALLATVGLIAAVVLRVWTWF
jgi:hypothetical protein